MPPAVESVDVENTDRGKPTGGVEVPTVICQLVESTRNTLLPEFCTATAVLEAIFMSSPPEPVNPDKNVPEEFCISAILAFWVAFARTWSWVASALPCR